MNNIIDILKKIWINPRLKALLILSLYLIFFVVIILMVRLSPSKKIKNEPNDSLNPLEEFSNKYDYDFKIIVDNNEINGHYSMNLITFEFDNKEYHYQNNVLEPDDFKYDEILNFIDTSYIYKLIKNKQIYSKTEYSDSTICNTYKIDNIDISLYEKKNIYEVDIQINDKIYKIIY